MQFRIPQQQRNGYICRTGIRQKDCALQFEDPLSEEQLFNVPLVRHTEGDQIVAARTAKQGNIAPIIGVQSHNCVETESSVVKDHRQRKNRTQERRCRYFGERLQIHFVRQKKEKYIPKHRATPEGKTANQQNFKFEHHDGQYGKPEQKFRHKQNYRGSELQYAGKRRTAKQNGIDRTDNRNEHEIEKKADSRHIAEAIDEKRKRGKLRRKSNSDGRTELLRQKFYLP